MKPNRLMKAAGLALMLLVFNQSAHAQFFKKLGKAVGKAATTVDKVSNSLSTDGQTASDTAKINWDKIPVYTARIVKVVDADGNPVLNEDGTPDYRVFLVNQFGEKRSPETVKAQIKIVNQRVLAILGKVGGGALLGALSKGAKGAAVGAAAGAVASADDIAIATKMKKSLRQQDKLLQAYEKNFTEEGKPVNATVDVKKLDGLNLTDDNASSMTAADIKKELEDEKFSATDLKEWDF